MNKMASETKVHYKSYKAGKRWMVASLSVVTLGLGLLGATETAQANTAEAPDDTSSSIKSGTSTTEAKQVTLNATPQVDEKAETPGDASKQGDAADAKEAPAAEAPGDAAVETPETNPKAPEAPAPTAPAPTAPADTQVKPATPEPVAPAENPEKTDTPAPETPAPVKAARSARAAVSPIDGVNASEWIPDASLRTQIIKVINKMAPTYNGQPTYIATEANLYQYVDKLQSIDDDATTGPITDFTGLNYFPNLHSLNFTNVRIPLSALIDFSVVPSLSYVSLYLANDGANHDLKTIMDTYFSHNENLSFLKLPDSYLTGNIPDLSKYTKLTMIYLPNNQLTGSIPDLSALPELWSVDVSHNQLSGAFPDIGNWPAMTTLNVSYNQLTGDLPDLSHFRGSLSYMFNHLTSGVIQDLGENGEPEVNYGVYQRLQGKTFKLSADQRSFDPVRGVVTGFQDMKTGQIDDNEGTWTAALANGITIAYGDLDPNLPTEEIPAWAATAEDATDWFSVQRISGNKVGLTFTAKQDVPDGTYTIQVLNQSFGALWGYSAYITFKIENEKPVDPGNPDTPDPGVTTGTVTIVNVDQDGKVISQSQQTGNVGDAFTINAPTIKGYKLVGDRVASGTYTAGGQTVTFTYQALSSGGDGDAVDPTNPTDPKKPVVDETGDTVNGGSAAQAVSAKRGGAATATAAKTVNLATTSTADTAAAKPASQQATTLPQTDATTTSAWAGLALLLGTVLTGLGLKRKSH
ncbi:MucBP domain-containing protein [Levilactobacillus tujiorum]|uniref:MucBP domain-containing protein n=1 Tax=Levilactobacillus tujiorum TaxID=2912243 RepID=UPI00145788A9|nr:MucBP domain-containing protein [Levilactobacillus tujiorum]NLR32373.1 KxYKxGKxW signal peptide domain-containing protein [Levilactobacillus tujiorum]